MGRQLSPEQAAAAAMVAQAKERGLALTGPDGLLKLFTKNVLETALNEEMTEHLGHEKNRADSDRGSTNVRNGTRPKTVLSDAANEVRIDVPRDRDSSFEPQIVKKRQRRLNNVDEIVLSLYSKGMTTGDISAHFADIYGASVSKETVAVAVGGEEPFEQQPPFDGVGVADAQGVADRGVGGGAPALAEDVGVAAEPHDVPHDQEIPGELQRLDHVELMVQLRIRLRVPVPVAVAPGGALPGQLPQVRGFGVLGGDGERG
jgi:hypothetical protein